MSSLRFLVIILILFTAVASAAEPALLQASPHISAVTVYADRAMTTRSSTLSLESGSYVVAFEGLPALIQDESVRVTGRGTAGATIIGLEVKRKFVEQIPEKRARELEQDILVLSRKVAALDAGKAALAAQRSFIDSIKVAWGDRISKELAIGKPTSDELNEALTFVGTGVTRVEEQVFGLEEEKRELKARIDALQRQRDQAIGSGRKETKSVEVTLEVAKAGKLDLDLTSVTGHTGWTPSYDARLATDGKSAELVFRAQVRQQTGEDWKNVNLSLSTARPAQGGAPPVLPPWRVSFFRPPPPIVPMAEMRDGAMAAAPSPRMLKREKAFTHEEFAEETAASDLVADFSEENHSVSFTIPRNVDVPADGTQHGSVVATEKLPLTLEFLTVPKLSQNVYLRSEIVNRAPYPLLPGRINIFTGGNYIGSSNLRKVAPGEKFDLFFGTDDQVTVKREEIKRHKEAGLFGKNRMRFLYRIEVQNFRKEPIDVTLHDQMPLAGDEEIKVILDDPSPDPAEQGTDGKLTWKLPVQPGEKKTLTFGIVVEYPKDREITGL